MSKSIWVIERGEYSDYRVVGVYSTREGAEIVCEQINRMEQYILATVAEWPLDPGVEACRQNWPVFVVEMLRNGHVEKCTRRPDHEIHLDSAITNYCVIYRRSQFVNYGQVTKDIQPQADCLEYYTFAPNADHAMAQADARRRQMIEKGEWEE